MWKNPVVTAIVGLLLGFFVGYIIGQGQPGTATASAGSAQAGVAAAPRLDGAPQQPPSGGRTQATADPRLMEQARELDGQLADHPKDYALLVQAGNVQYDLNNYLKARDFYERARQIRDDSPDVLTDLGVCYRETNEPRKAVELFDRASDMDPNHWQSRYNAAVVLLFDLNELDAAQAELDKLKKVGVSDPHVASITALEQEIAKRRK